MHSKNTLKKAACIHTEKPIRVKFVIRYKHVTETGEVYAKEDKTNHTIYGCNSVRFCPCISSKLAATPCGEECEIQ